MTNVLQLPLRPLRVAQRVVELSRHLEANRPAWVLIPGDLQVKLVWVGHTEVTVDIGAGERRTLPALDVEVLP